MLFFENTLSNFLLIIVVLYFLSLISIIFARCNLSKLSNLLGFTSAIFSFLIAASRPDYFPDYQSYNLIFNQSSKIIEENSFWVIHSEPGFKIINFLVSFFGLNFEFLLLFISFLSLVLLLVTAHLGKVKFVYLWFAYFSLYFITRDLGVIRLSIASHLIVISILQSTFLKKLFILFISCFTFQYFSFITLLANFFKNKKPTIELLLLFLMISFLFAFLIKMENIHFLVPKMQSAYINDIQGSVAYDRVILPLFRNFVLGIIIYFLMTNEQKSSYNLVIWMIILSIFSYIAFSGVLVLANRFSAYFGAVYPLAFSIILNNITLSKIKFLILIILLTFNFISVIFYNSWVRF